MQMSSSGSAVDLPLLKLIVTFGACTYLRVKNCGPEIKRYEVNILNSQLTEGILLPVVMV